MYAWPHFEYQVFLSRIYDIEFEQSVCFGVMSVMQCQLRRRFCFLKLTGLLPCSERLFACYADMFSDARIVMMGRVEIAGQCNGRKTIRCTVLCRWLSGAVLLPVHSLNVLESEMRGYFQ